MLGPLFWIQFLYSDVYEAERVEFHMLQWWKLVASLRSFAEKLERTLDNRNFHGKKSFCYAGQGIRSIHCI